MSTSVELRGVSKVFGGVEALRNIDLEIAAGSVHALVGENGAGKSTLGKIVSGAVRPSDGELFVNGQARPYRSPHEAIRDGIVAIQQEIALVPARSVLENVFLGVELKKRGLPNNRLMRSKMRSVQEEIGFHIEPDVPVSSLGVADQQKVEVLRAVLREAGLVVMDEPTAALGINEVEALLATVRRLKSGGTTVVFVSHRLGEVMSIADTVTVLRNGTLIASSPSSETDTQKLVTQMLGRSLGAVFPPRPSPPGISEKAVLSLREVHLIEGGPGISFDIRKGEIVGMAGIVGSGRSEVARAVFGADGRASGSILLNGQELTIRSPRDAIGAGIAMLPEKRKDDGLLMARSVGENVALPSIPRLKSWWGGVGSGAEREEVKQLLETLDVRPPDPKRSVGTLSGGNQQKVLFCKWLGVDPQVLIADEPTRGVDVGAKAAIYELLVGLAAKGIALLVISSELPEVMNLCHRVLVMRQGAIVAEFSGGAEDEEAIMHAALGTQQDVGVAL
jgi:simple sugar transport system ATP-binding protein/ribose transport system ATP-binding protein